MGGVTIGLEIKRNFCFRGGGGVVGVVLLFVV